MIELEQVTKQYGQHRVLHHITATFSAGGVYGIVGENGAGKTTLFRCIAGLEPYEGQIRSLWQPLKHHLGFLPTQPYFPTHLTGEEYLYFLGVARQKRLENIADRDVFDLPLGEYADTYSTGMKKKLALLGLLLQGNEVFILDEPFNGVDIHSNLLITEIIHRLRALGKTILISSHIFSTLRDTCDALFVLRGGQFGPRVEKPDFNALEAEMKSYTIGNVLDRLSLS